MDALISTFLSVLLAEMGDRTQILAAALAIRYRHDKTVLVGMSLATLANCAISAMGGSVIDAWISEAPVKLFAAMAYVFAGVGMLLWRRPVDILENWKTPPFLTAFLGLFILEFGDKSQFIIAAQSARYDYWFMVGIGGFAAIMAAVVPAVLLGARLSDILPLRAIRLGGGIVLTLLGIILGLQAFGLV